VEAGTEPGATVRLRGEGLPRFQGSGRGNLLVRVHYDVPRNPGKSLRKALEALGEAERDEIGPLRRRFADALKNHVRALEHRRKK
jgi:molecular chaperone DnaJ